MKEGSLNICNLRGRCYGPMNKPIITRNLDTSKLLNLDGGGGGGGLPHPTVFAKMVMMEVFTIGAKMVCLFFCFCLAPPPIINSTYACRQDFRYPNPS